MPPPPLLLLLLLLLVLLELAPQLASLDIDSAAFDEPDNELCLEDVRNAESRWRQSNSSRSRGSTGSSAWKAQNSSTRSSTSPCTFLSGIAMPKPASLRSRLEASASLFASSMSSSSSAPISSRRFLMVSDMLATLRSTRNSRPSSLTSRTYMAVDLDRERAGEPPSE